MHYEKAELILEQLMAREQDLFLVRDPKDGKAIITDRPKSQQVIVGELKRKRIPLLKKAVTILICFLCPITINSGIVKTKCAIARKSSGLESVVLEECSC